MRRYVWLGDSKDGGSVYWDKKMEVPLKNVTSKSSATKGKLNIRVFIGTLIVLVIFRLYFSANGMEKVNNISVAVFTIFFTMLFTYLIYHAVYGSYKDYEKTTLEDAMYAIESTGYLQNPYIYMLFDKKLKIMVLLLIILGICFGLSQVISELAILYVCRIPCMLLLVGISVYIIYLVNFKKDNRLKL